MSRVREAVRRIAELEQDGLNATINFNPESVSHRIPDVSQSRGDDLDGMPLAVKDNIATFDFPTTCASRALSGYSSPFEATAVSRLKEAGAVVVCKTNMDEFGMGSSTEYSAFGPCRNPIDPERVPGGSSGGSAALVASGAVPAALGSETGGSVRQPASFCGIVGFKPTYGAVSRFGLVAFGSSLDQIGVLGASATSVAAVMGAIAGHDHLDSTSIADRQINGDVTRDDLSGLTVGIPLECFPDDLDPAIKRACDRAVGRFRHAGAKIKDVSLPHVHLAVAAYYVIAPAEASANLARYDGVRYGTRPGDAATVRAMICEARAHGFGKEVKRRILVGTYVLSAGYYDAFYRKAQGTRGLIASDFERAFTSGIDLLFTPTCPTTAYRIGEQVDDPVRMYTGDRFVCPANLAGLPAISFPIGRTRGLPIGGQLIGPSRSDFHLIEATRMELLVDPVGEA
jgi:aspartyl-tRNA(Asn)/glutamyl-tRNA(Gln) amidotransferase subunit A